MGARVVRAELDHLGGASERRLGGVLIAGLPVVDLVVLLALLLVADQCRVGLARLVGAGDHREDLVVDLDQADRVLGGVLGLGHHRRHLLALEADLVGGQHGLGVAGEGGHPGQVVLRHQVAGHHGDHARDCGGRGGVHGTDAGVCVRAAQDCHVEHARERDVVQVVPLATEEAGVLLALDGLADSTVRLHLDAHDSPPEAAATGVAAVAFPALSWAAWRTDLTMLT